MSNLTALIEALEAATEPSRDLDTVIALRIEYPFTGWPSFEEHRAKHDYSTAFVAHAPWRLNRIPKYTSSIDAALTLVPAGAEYSISTLYSKAEVELPLNSGDGLTHLGQRLDGNVPIAICIAALKDRQATALPAHPGHREG